MDCKETVETPYQSSSSDSTINDLGENFNVEYGDGSVVQSPRIISGESAQSAPPVVEETILGKPASQHSDDVLRKLSRQQGPGGEKAQRELERRELAQREQSEPDQKPDDSLSDVGRLRRGEIGGHMSSGEVVLTASGRRTTPFPAINTGKRFNSTSKKVEQWLLQNAHDEAVARGDRFNALSFKNDLAIFDRPRNRGNQGDWLPQATKDAAEAYLFGEQPNVVPGITRPMPSSEGRATRATSQNAAQSQSRWKSAGKRVRDFAPIRRPRVSRSSSGVESGGHLGRDGWTLNSKVSREPPRRATSSPASGRGDWTTLPSPYSALEFSPRSFIVEALFWP
jgi:hypothetical protein